MKRHAALLITALMLAPLQVAAQEWSMARSCLDHATRGTLKEFAVQVPSANGNDTYCLGLADSTRVCADLSPYLAYNDSGTLTVTRPHQPIRQWHVEATLRWNGSPARPDTANIQAFVADLDGDGKPELVVAALEMVGNGMGIASWQITMVNGRQGAEPQSVEAQDYNSRGSWVRLPGYRHCFFLATGWRDLDFDARRGRGTYFVGVLQPYVAGVLSDSTLPVGRVRRRLNSFGARPHAPPEPLGLLTDRRAQSLPVNEATSGRAY
jgi:hypothetical protein